MRIERDPLVCENCGELDHDDIETVSDVPQLDPESYEVGPESSDVYVCAGCKNVIGVE
ncbi:hypothetical protein [Haloarchaeobius amylolyticus]|uniref:hypothetical protein n=1 Tax=Haloarchaeobius amylolyticus TaxID=1198296 RepID=UPI00226EF0D9|nr:hypothetical protein [Haloarchaeobius amylolyticus]